MPSWRIVLRGELIVEADNFIEATEVGIAYVLDEMPIAEELFEEVVCIADCDQIVEQGEGSEDRAG